MRMVVALLLLLSVSPVSGADLRQQQAQAITAEIAAALGSFQPQRAADLAFAQQRLQDAIQLAPQYGPTYRALGELQLQQADYFQAITAFDTALQLDPFDRAAQRGLASAERLSDLVVQLQLPFPQRVFGLAEVPREGRPGVFLLVGAPELWGPVVPSAELQPLPTNDVRLSVWGAQVPRAQPQLLSPEVRYLTWGGRGFLRGYRETYRTGEMLGADPFTFWRVWTGDFQRTGRFQVLLVMGWLRADSTPTLVDIFETEGDSLREVLQADSVFPPELVDLDGDGRIEVKTEQFVGVTLPQEELGAWYDLYAYDGWEYVRANQFYPAFAEEQLLRMLRLEQIYPDDPDLQARVEQAYRDLGY